MVLIDKETVRKEIKRRIEENTCPKVHDDTEFSVWSAKDDLLDDILHLLDTLPEQPVGEISDGYHTFNELYYYRMLYNAAFFNSLAHKRDNGHWDVDYGVHKSKRHHTGEECFGGGWFIVMANLPTGQISNHYELKDWDLFQIPEKEIADKWDGHTPQDAAERLHKYLQRKQPVEGLDVTDFCKPIDPGIAQCVADHWWEMTGEESTNKKPVEELEDEAESYWVEAGWSKVMTLGRFKTIARHFAEWGRKQVLQEIYDGKVKPVDKTIAAWLDD